PEPLIRVEKGDAGDCALQVPGRPAATSAVRHTQHRSHACVPQRMSLTWLRVAPTTAIRTPLYKPYKKQFLCSPSSLRTRQSEKATGGGDTQRVASTHTLTAIQSSYLYSVPDKYTGL